jgi:glycosyltransferase involved in cell wall biosynthesis
MGHSVLVDGVFYQIGKSGIARVWNKLFAQWVVSGFAEEVVVVDRNHTAQRVPGITYIDAPPFFYEREAEDRAMLQAMCDEHGAKVFISTYYTTPLSTPSLMMVHDMIPEVLAWDLNQPMWRQKQSAMRYASAFVTVSTNTANDLKRFVGQPMGPVSVAHNGCDFTPASAEEVQAFRDKHGLHRPYFLLSGSRNNYKNAQLFFQAFEKLGDERSRYGIVCSGGGRLDEAMLACVGGAEVCVGVLTDDEMRCAYSGALALIYPSLYEGFGLPLLESMACGCPAISTHVASLPEVGGDAPLYIEVGPDAADQLAAHLRQVQVPAVRASMIAKGLRQAQGFRWDIMAAKVQACLMSLAARSRPEAPPIAPQPTKVRRGGPGKRTIAAVIADTDCHVLALNALHHSASRFDFDQVIVYSDRPEAWAGYPVLPIPTLTSVAEYNALIVKRLPEDLRCDHALVMQFDGFILNPEQWAELFLTYDYIGAPWPHHTGHVVGNGGFSLRSRRLVETVATLDYPDLNEAEDLHICRHLRPTLEDRGMRFPSADLAAHFSVEFPRVPWPTFGFHGLFHLPDVYRDAPRFLLDNLSDRVIKGRPQWLLPGLKRIDPALEEVFMARLQRLQEPMAA